MSLKERVYSVLIVSSTTSFNNAIPSLLPKSKYNLVNQVSSVSAAKRSIAERSYDFVVIYSPLPDDIGTRFAIDSCSNAGTVVLQLINTELHAEIYDKVAEHGVFTLPTPMSKQTFTNALSWMASARERLRKNEKKTLSFEEKMEEIRVVNRAKWLLISEKQMDESDAHRYIEKMAMDRCVSKKEIAEEIINGKRKDL